MVLIPGVHFGVMGGAGMVRVGLGSVEYQGGAGMVRVGLDAHKPGPWSTALVFGLCFF